MSLLTSRVDPDVTSSPGRERYLGDGWFKRWETTSDPGGDNRDRARWSAIKCRYRNRAQPVVIATRSSIFLLFLHFIPSIAKEASLVNPSIVWLETMKIVFEFTLLCAAVVFVAAQGAQEQERPKTFRRLIPADVLRGELILSQSFPEILLCGKLAVWETVVHFSPNLVASLSS